LLLALIAGLAWTAQGLRAEDAGPDAAAARLSFVEGQVQVSQSGQVLADQAPVNAPLFDGAQIATGGDGKAEIQFEDGSVARISPNSTLTLIALSGPNGPQIALEGGLGYFELQGGQNNPLRINFADSTAVASGFTVLRIRMDAPPGELAVFSGNVHLDRASALSLDLHGGESVALNAADAGRYSLAESIEPDSWDAWNSDRDEALNAASTAQTGAASNFAASEAPNPAWNDLDANGNWYNMPGQGYIWSPYAASNAGWDPYGCGRWMWTPRFGYVWVSCESWGFMPYMCGSWGYYESFGWGWSPAMGVGCGRRWGMGSFGGVHVINAPAGYRLLERPGAKRPIGRYPQPIVVVNRAPAGVGNGLPVRARNTSVTIGGQTIRPLQPIGSRSGDQPGQSFVRRTEPTSGSVRTEGTPGAEFGSGRSTYVVNANGGGRPSYGQPTSGLAGQSYVRTSQPVSMPAQNLGPNSPQNQNPRQGFVQQPRGSAQPTSSQPVARPAQTYNPPPRSYSGGGNSGGYTPSRSAPSPSSGGGSSHSGGYSGGGGGFSGGGGNSGGGGASHSTGGGGSSSSSGGHH
jgi:hypothetical protein